MEELHNTPDCQIPVSVSFRQLAHLLQQAPGETERIEADAAGAGAEREAFERLLAEWSRSGQRLLAALGSGSGVITAGRSPRQLMALGTLQAHIALALQAQAAAGYNQPE